MKRQQLTFNHVHEAKPGMDIQVLVDIHCPNGHPLHGLKRMLEYHQSGLAGYFVSCPECGGQTRLLRSEFDITKRVKPKPRTKTVASF